MKRSIAQFAQVLAEAPEMAVAELGLATALEAAGREHDAFVHYRNAATLDPQYIEALDKALTAFAGRHPAEAQLGMQRLNGFIKSLLIDNRSPRTLCSASPAGSSAIPWRSIASASARLRSRVSAAVFSSGCV